MPYIDLNCDLGESFGAYTIGMDEKVIPFITSANVACGFHAGDPLVMQRTVALCKQSGVAVGAHPGFPDLQGFGRRQMKLTPAEAKACVQYQIGALKAFCDAAGVPLHHVKPHGALYNMAGKDCALADAICAAVKESAPGAVLLALCGRFYRHDRAVYISVIVCTLLAALYDLICALPEGLYDALHADAVQAFGLRVLPFAGAGLGWICPLALGFVSGLAVHLIQKFRTK